MQTTEIQEFLNSKLGDIAFGAVIVAVAILIIGIILANVIANIIEKALGKTKLDEKIIIIITRIFRTVFIVGAVVISVNSLGIDTSFVTGFVLIFSLIVAFMVQRMIENVVAGFSIRNSKAFKVGDYIETGSNSGEVLESSLSYTKIKTDIGEVVTIPNKSIQDAPLINHTPEKGRPIVIDVPVDLKDDIDKVIGALKYALESVSDILPDQPKTVHLKAIAKMNIQYRVTCYALQENYLQVSSDLNIAICRQFKACGITFAWERFGMMQRSNSTK